MVTTSLSCLNLVFDFSEKKSFWFLLLGNNGLLFSINSLIDQLIEIEDVR